MGVPLCLACSEPGDPVHLWCQRCKEILKKAIDLSQQRSANAIAPTDFEGDGLQGDTSTGGGRTNLLLTHSPGAPPPQVRATLRRIHKGTAKDTSQALTPLSGPR